jgi:hypothetical protein
MRYQRALDHHSRFGIGGKEVSRICGTVATSVSSWKGGAFPYCAGVNVLIGSPLKKRTLARAAFVCRRYSERSENQATCGVRITFGRLRRGCPSGRGSGVDTSRAAPASFFARSASVSPMAPREASCRTPQGDETSALQQARAQMSSILQSPNRSITQCCADRVAQDPLCDLAALPLRFERPQLQRAEVALPSNPKIAKSLNHAMLC